MWSVIPSSNLSLAVSECEAIRVYMEEGMVSLPPDQSDELEEGTVDFSIYAVAAAVRITPSYIRLSPNGKPYAPTWKKALQHSRRLNLRSLKRVLSLTSTCALRDTSRDAIDKYIEERDKAKAHGYKMFDPGSKKIASAWEHLKDYKALHKKLIETGEIDEKKLKGVQINILALKDLMSPYINAIVELAECGVAVPELALSPDDQYAGTEGFQAFIELINKRDELEKKIEARYSQWVSASGGKSAPPGVLFVSLQKQFR